MATETATETSAGLGGKGPEDEMAGGPSWHDPAAPPPCRYGMECARAECLYLHPPEWVAAPPPCHFGKDCLWAACPFVHPNGRGIPGCVYGRGCAEKGCPYSHDRSRSPPAAGARPCRYRASCCSRTCPYVHPPGWSPARTERAVYARNAELPEADGHRPLCRFGGRCLLPGCAYRHPAPGGA